MVHRDFVFSVFSVGLLLAGTAATVFERSEDSCGVVLNTDVFEMLAELAFTDFFSNTTA